MSAARAEFRRGWRALLACTLGAGLGFTLFGYMFSLFVAPLQSAFGWSRGAIGGVLVAVPITALALPAIGAAIDRFGPGRIIGLSTVGLSASYLLLTGTDGDIGRFYAGYGLAALIGSATGPIGYARVLVSWFEAARGTALALMLAGGSIAAAILSPLLSATIETAGFRAGFAVLAGAALLGGGAALALGLRLGPVTSVSRADESYQPLGSRRTFMLLGCSLFLAGIPAIGLASQLQPLFVARGFGAGAAAAMIGILALAVLGGRLVTGVLLDRLRPTVVAATVMIVAAAGALVLAVPGGHAAVAVVGVLCIGLSQGAELDLLSFLCARYFGLSRYARTYGKLFLCYATALPLGGLLFGLSHDLTGSYATALGVSAGLLASSAVLFVLLEPRAKP